MASILSIGDCDTAVVENPTITSEGIEQVIAFAERRKPSESYVSRTWASKATVREVLVSIDDTLPDKVRSRITDYKEENPKCCWTQDQLESLAESVLVSRYVPIVGELEQRLSYPTLYPPTILQENELPRVGQMVTDRDQKEIGILSYHKTRCLRPGCTSPAFKNGQSVVLFRYGWAHPRADDPNVPPEPVVSYGPCQSCQQPFVGAGSCMATILGGRQVHVQYDNDGWGSGCTKTREGENASRENSSSVRAGVGSCE